ADRIAGKNHQYRMAHRREVSIGKEVGHHQIRTARARTRDLELAHAAALQTVAEAPTVEARGRIVADVLGEHEHLAVVGARPARVAHRDLGENVAGPDRRRTEAHAYDQRNGSGLHAY